MALIANSTYAFVDLNDEQVFVSTDDLTDRSTWSSAVSYSLMDAVLYQGGLYVCLTGNINVPPSGNLSDEWSALVLVRTGSGGHTADEAYALAEEALETAVEVGQDGSNYAFNLYVAGTNYTNVQAVAALGTVAQQGSNYAFSLYVAGTNYTNTAAVAAVQVAAQEGSQYATMLRDQGTNYTDAQVAVEALARANGDVAVFISASQFTTQQVNIESAQRIHDDGTIASNGSAYSFLLYEAGTNFAQTIVSAEAAVRAANDYAFFIAGTQYTDAQVQQAQVIAGSLSTELFWAGTAYTDLRVNTEAGERMNGDVTLQSWVGTNRDMIEDLAAILGASFNGTFSLYMAQVSRGKPDTRITVVGGVVTGFEQSPFIWEDWVRYSAGPAPSSFNKGSSWSEESYGSITTEVYGGTVAQDGIQTYAQGTIQLMNDGIGFNVTGTFAQPYSTQIGVDAFDYTLGTIVNPDMSGGSTWVSPAVIFQY